MIRKREQEPGAKDLGLGPGPSSISLGDPQCSVPENEDFPPAPRGAGRLTWERGRRALSSTDSIRNVRGPGISTFPAAPGDPSDPSCRGESGGLRTPTSWLPFSNGFTMPMQDSRPRCWRLRLADPTTREELASLLCHQGLPAPTLPAPSSSAL